mmetsp:Transcript_28245/g.47972  ORF Transcript_28245/g.47972 Transcript_28245/m.47972 type:complete len:143 (-) Transcript_28245:57-485(-)|eukprot:CAMPEP_0174280880 /NCGR_PEP_ID=MMETSP0809-20121228/1207_1 /TAXON_ID=73025 ORGANISM="Eutreptiella gymnastica-like, Strain CCMP1594" /NCGR_SAMPLE_ID=MMETSP0809 /ASSEMBLY_ACC=CAM_ASM_000658 /LENGTH=142 /DNA_ID=CAMNT_0015374063 /DNA_START=25 /DNA_END=453 /DNA_ORIENTATION=-
MTKGTTSFGKRNGRSHGLCPRCGKRSYNLQKAKCAACGYPSAKMRKYNWSEKARRRRTMGTGRMQYMRTILRKAAHTNRNNLRGVNKPKQLKKELRNIERAKHANEAPLGPRRMKQREHRRSCKAKAKQLKREKKDKKEAKA